MSDRFVAAGTYPTLPAQSLVIVPCTITEAKVYVRESHRHAPTIQGGLFAVGLALAPGPRPLIGVAIVGRPSRLLQDGWTCAITRLATDGSRNACSMLYGAAWRAARDIGYRRARTYTLTTESGASLRAIGARELGLTEGRTHSRLKRPRTDKHELAPRRIWELTTPHWRALDLAEQALRAVRIVEPPSLT